MAEQLEHDDLSKFEPIRRKINQFDEIFQEEEKDQLIRKCSKIIDLENFATCMQNGEKKINQIFKTFDYKTLYMSKQLETCLKQKGENNCVREALDALDLYVAESKKELQKL